MSSFKGMLGEAVINVATWLMLDKDVYHRINNVTLPLPDGGSTQIDHVIVSVYGIFVIETKNYKGWIFGNEKQRQWTQTLGGKKYKFQNPLRQNYLHIKTLSDLLGLELSYFHSMIAFIGDCQLKTRDQLPKHVLTSGMVSYIKNKQDEILSEAQVQAIVGQIEAGRFTKSWRTNAQHKAYVKNKVAGKTLKDKVPTETSKNIVRASNNSAAKPPVFITPFAINDSDNKVTPDEDDKKFASQPEENQVASQPACPKCGSDMIRRVAKSGQRQGQSFWGCSQFPKCRGVVNIDFEKTT